MKYLLIFLGVAVVGFMVWTLTKEKPNLVAPPPSPGSTAGNGNATDKLFTTACQVGGAAAASVYATPAAGAAVMSPAGKGVCGLVVSETKKAVGAAVNASSSLLSGHITAKNVAISVAALPVTEIVASKKLVTGGFKAVKAGAGGIVAGAKAIGHAASSVGHAIASII